MARLYKVCVLPDKVRYTANSDYRGLKWVKKSIEQTLKNGISASYYNMGKTTVEMYVSGGGYYSPLRIVRIDNETGVNYPLCAIDTQKKECTLLKGAYVYQSPTDERIINCALNFLCVPYKVKKVRGVFELIKL